MHHQHTLILQLLIGLQLISTQLNAQEKDSTSNESDTVITFKSPNALLLSSPNYESLNNSFLSGAAFPFIRNQDNPLITIDGVPANPTLFANMPYREFTGYPSVLSFDVKDVAVHTYGDDTMIASGQYMNLVGISTQDAVTGKRQPTFFANNFSSSEGQSEVNPGFAIINSIGASAGIDKLGYRASLNSGFHDSYLPDNGMKRIGTNIKVRYEPFANFSATGFIDYSRLRDFRRTDGYQVLSDKLFSYARVDYRVKAFDIYWLWSYSKLDENLLRDLIATLTLFNGTKVDEYFSYSAELSNRAAFADAGFRYGFRSDKVSVRITGGGRYLATQQSKATVDRWESLTPSGGLRIENQLQKYQVTQFQPHASVRLVANQFEFKCTTDYTIYASGLQPDNNAAYTNALVVSKVELFKKKEGFLNSVKAGFKFAAVTNLISSTSFTTNDWALNKSRTIEPVLQVRGLNQKVAVNFGYYKRTTNDQFDRYYRNLGVLSSTGVTIPTGDVTQEGVEASATAVLYKQKDVSWVVNFSAVTNKVNVKPSLQWDGPTTDMNKVFRFANDVSYKRMRFMFALKKKEGYDYALEGQRITGHDPTIQRLFFSSYVTGLDDEGSPKIATANLRQTYKADYLILEHASLQYEHPSQGKVRWNAGLVFNRIRRVHTYINDVLENYLIHRAQSPSFFNTIGISVGVKVR